MSELGLDFHKFYYRQLLWVKDRVALRWVDYAATNQITYLIKQNSQVNILKSSSYILGSFTLHFGLKYEMIYQLDAIEYLFVFFQLDMFRASTPIFRSNGCYNFFTYTA